MELTPDDVQRMETHDYWSVEAATERMAAREKARGWTAEQAAAELLYDPHGVVVKTTIGGSENKGGGLRHDAGKPDYSLVPLRLMLPTLQSPNDGAAWVLPVLRLLAAWQERSGTSNLAKAWNVLGQEAWAECTQVFTFGASKYAAWNWARGMPWSKPFACAVRHCLAILRGEDTDPESGLPHRGHLACNLVMLLTYAETYPEGDDRAPAGSLAALPQAEAPAFPPIDRRAGVSLTEPIWPPLAAKFTWLAK